jgi:FkbM family methyltransferase
MVINKVSFNQLSQTWQHVALTSSISQGYYPDDLECSANNIITQAKKFEQLLSENRFWSSCYANDYLAKLYLADLNMPHRHIKLFFDVGANKGYTIASWLSVWMPDIGLNPKSLYVYLSQVLNISDCGVCSDCNETMLNDPQRNDRLGTTLEIHAFEPMKATYQVLFQVRTWFNISRLYIYQLAISNTTGIAAMSKCSVGGEGCGLMSVGRAVPNETTFQSQTMTLDDFVEQKKIKQKIDLIKIDTEGADPLVIQGAKKLFSREQIRMLIFENHGIGAWKTTSLLEVIQSLNSKGFTCHMLGRTGMVRLTNCWSPVFDVKYWSNILCVHRREERLRRFLDQLLISNI